jgi:hypothetical protein
VSLSERSEACSAAESPDTVLVVSAGQVRGLCDGLLSELGFAGEELGELSLRQRLRGRGPYQERVRHINAVYTFLEEIGWDDVEVAPRVRVDLGAHGALALMVLGRLLEAELDGLADVPRAQRQAAEQHIRELREFIEDVRQLPDPTRRGRQ